ncbi:hypothetical protein GGP79_002327 [Salinibacter ruber]|uniref:O-antigen polymerase n=1 Tax=Salinibacter ruber TaxID=146919 RepID=UPI002168404A|nr:O-antigen polymerase [Salinibacter ruber]MCS3754363.1 hypothetical protein [Salinibacter ruber]
MNRAGGSRTRARAKRPRSAPNTPDWGATGLFLATLFVTAFFLDGRSSYAVAHRAAIGVGIGLGGLTLLEMRHSWRNLFRADLMAMAALYFLTLFEFWFSQSAFANRITASLVQQGAELVLWGFGGLALGRHFVPGHSQKVTRLMRQPTPPSLIVGVFWVCMGIGYLYMLLAVNFNLVAMVESMLGPRFGRPWGRGRLGGWYALLYELHLFKYLIPPLFGVVVARRNRYSTGQIVSVVAGGLFTFFDGFASGTRNIFGVYLLTFLVGYSFALPHGRWKKAAVVSGAGTLLMYWATSVMLAFRNIGLGAYLAIGGRARYLESKSGLFIDYNLQNISRLTEVFPEPYGYVGWEVPYWALVRPIPRALWPGKPKGLSTGIEEALGAEGLTLSTTFVGEAYMAGGTVGVVLIAMVLGMLSSWWTQHLERRNSDLGILVYASGFFAIAIGMRSMFWVTTGMLPAVAAVVIGTILLRRYTASRPQRAARAVH